MISDEEIQRNLMSHDLLHFNLRQQLYFLSSTNIFWVTIKELGNEALKCQKEISLPYCHVLIFKWFFVFL